MKSSDTKKRKTKDENVQTKHVKKKRKRLRFGGLIVVLLILYIIGMGIYNIITMPVKNIYIEGLTLVSENEILNKINLKEDTPIIKLPSSSIKKKVESLDLVNEVKVKKSILGNLTITVTENTVLYFDTLNNKYVLSDGTKIENNNFVGYPTLVNYVPSKIEEKLIKGLKKVDKDIIIMVSEIEYSPDSYNDTVIDDERFILRMNDGNTVYVNMVNIEKLNEYQNIYASISSGGTLYLDSNSKNYIFKSYSEEPVEEETEEKEEKKKDES